MLRWGLIAVLAWVASGCESPEATRTRGGGPGADSGNRPAEVRMHAGSDQYWDTPNLIHDWQHPPLDGARHARRTSR